MKTHLSSRLIIKALVYILHFSPTEWAAQDAPQTKLLQPFKETFFMKNVAASYPRNVFVVRERLQADSAGMNRVDVIKLWRFYQGQLRETTSVYSPLYIRAI